MRRLRIAFVSAGHFPHVHVYIDYFASRGHEVIWAAYDRVTGQYGVRTYDISAGADVRRPLSKWRYLLSGVRLRRVLKAFRPDLVHGHYVTSAGVVCLLSGFRPYILTAHGGDVMGSLDSPAWKVVLRRVFRRAACVNPVSEPLAAHVRQIGAPPERILVATPGVNTERLPFAPRRRTPGRSKIICTRKLAEVYDPHTLIRACRVLKEQGLDFEMTFAAGGPLEASLRTAVNAWGLDGRVRFLGGYSADELPTLLHESDVYVSASSFDGTSLSLLEAMACGVLPVVSRTPSNEQWLQEGRTGFMFACGDARGAAESIIRAASGSHVTESALEENRRTVERKGDRQRNMGCLEDMFYCVTESSK